MVCRSDINLILFKALLLAEKEIGKDKKLDQAIAERIGLKARDRSPQAEDPLTGFFLETGPTLADQSLGSKVTFHGELDYLIQVSSYKHGKLECFLLTAHTDRSASQSGCAWYQFLISVTFVY